MVASPRDLSKVDAELDALGIAEHRLREVVARAVALRDSLGDPEAALEAIVADRADLRAMLREAPKAAPTRSAKPAARPKSGIPAARLEPSSPRAVNVNAVAELAASTAATEDAVKRPASVAPPAAKRPTAGKSVPPPRASLPKKSTPPVTLSPEVADEADAFGEPSTDLHHHAVPRLEAAAPASVETSDIRGMSVDELFADAEPSSGDALGDLFGGEKGSLPAELFGGQAISLGDQLEPESLAMLLEADEAAAARAAEPEPEPEISEPPPAPTPRTLPPPPPKPRSVAPPFMPPPAEVYNPFEEPVERTSMFSAADIHAITRGEEGNIRVGPQAEEEGVMPDIEVEEEIEEIELDDDEFELLVDDDVLVADDDVL